LSWWALIVEAAVLLAASIVGHGSSGTLWLVVAAAVLVAAAMVRSRWLRGGVAVVAALGAVSMLASEYYNGWATTLLIGAACVVAAEAVLVLLCSVPPRPITHRCVRLTATALAFLVGVGLIVGAALLATWTVHPPPDSLFLPPAASCGSAVRPTRFVGVGAAGSAALGATVSSDCIDGRQTRESEAISALGAGLLALAVAYGLGRRVRRGRPSPSAGSSPIEENSASSASWRRALAVLGAIGAVASGVGAVVAARTASTLTIGADPAASDVAVHLCQATLSFSGQALAAVRAESGHLGVANPIPVRRQAVIALVVETRNAFDTMVSSVRDEQQHTQDPGYRAFLDNLVSRMNPTADRLASLNRDANALPTTQPDFDTDRLLIANQMKGVGASFTFTPELLRGLSLRDALSLSGALYNNPACAPITGTATG
jgi:hypothetical protein